MHFRISNSIRNVCNIHVYISVSEFKAPEGKSPRNICTIRRIWYIYDERNSNFLSKCERFEKCNNIFFCSLLNLILDFNVRKCVCAISNDTLKLNIETKTANSKMRYFAAVNKVTVVLSSFSLSWNVLITLFVAFIACCTSLWKFYRCNAHANRVSSCLKLVYFIPCMLLFLLSLHIVILSIRVHCANSCFGYSFPMFPYNIHSTSSICVSTLSYLHNLPPRLVSSLIFSLFSFFLSFRWFHFIATLAPSSCLPYVLSQINNIITRW